MHIILRTSIVLLTFLAANLSLWAQHEEPDLWIYYEESVWVVDTAKADSMVAQLNQERYAEAAAYVQRQREKLESDISEIEQLMEYEKSGKRIKEGNLHTRLSRYAWKKKNLSDKDKKMIIDGKVPKGLTTLALTGERDELKAKLDALSIQYSEVTYSDINLPKKKNVQQKRKPNPECRDNYFNGTFVREKVNSWGMENHFTPFTEYEHWKKQDAAQESIGWEWLYTENIQNETKYVKTYFPEELGYHQHPAHPEYRLKYVIDWGGYNAFDEKGALVRVDNMTKFFRFTKYQDEVLDNIFMQLCKRDFLANKYDINSAKPETLLALRIKFDLADAVDARFKKYMKMAQDARDEKLSATTPAQYVAAQKKQNKALNVLMEYVVKEREPQAMNYIKQLKSDHAAELSYLYKIERVDNVTFKLYFLNDKMECGCVALMKWSNKEPYEAQYNIELLPIETITIRK